MAETEMEDPLATILRDYAGLEGLGRTGRVIRELVAEVRSARRERDEALAWKQALQVEVETVLRNAAAGERARLAQKLRVDFPLNRHAQEWADWILREST